eukprot:scaffold120003_cov21-Tisochrysis_lutea.AAC.1
MLEPLQSRGSKAGPPPRAPQYPAGAVSTITAPAAGGTQKAGHSLLCNVARDSGAVNLTADCCRGPLQRPASAGDGAAAGAAAAGAGGAAAGAGPFGLSAGA